MESGLADLARRLAPEEFLASEADLAAYSYDGALEKHRPDAVVVPADVSHVFGTVGWCVRRGLPVVARGAGTNLSGGCIPTRGGVVLSLARLNRILAVDSGRLEACVEPGVVNLKLQDYLAPLGLFYAPDPASYRVCTLGGNVAENAGGPRCLKYGTTTNHVRAVEAAMPDGSLARFAIDDEGPDLVGLMVGAEGTLGVVTKIWLNLIPAPKTIRTILAGFPSVKSSVECVSAIVAAGILPRVLEAMDRMTVESVEAFNHAGYPDTEAVLLIELDGDEARVADEAREVEALCRRHGVSEYRQATDPIERERLWEGRRGAYAALARIAPNVLVEDGVVPRNRLPGAFDRVQAIAKKHDVRVAMLFHAGDGNLHPNMAFDERDADETRRTKAAGFEMLGVCVELEGSLSGEHGIGTDKRAAMAGLFSAETLALFRRIKTAFDPGGLFNPDKVIPLPNEVPPAAIKARAPRELSPQAAKLVEKLRAGGGSFSIRGAGTKMAGSRHSDEILCTRELTGILELDRANLTARVEAGVTPKQLKDALGEDLFAPVPDLPGTIGGLIATKAWPGMRDHLIGMRLALSNGELVELGGKVVKNVAGYDVAKVLLGSWGALAVILDVTLKLYPFEIPMPRAMPAVRPFVPNAWHRRLKEAFDPRNRFNGSIYG